MTSGSTQSPCCVAVSLGVLSGPTSPCGIDSSVCPASPHPAAVQTLGCHQTFPRPTFASSIPLFPLVSPVPTTRSIASCSLPSLAAHPTFDSLAGLFIPSRPVSAFLPYLSFLSLYPQRSRWSPLTFTVAQRFPSTATYVPFVESPLSTPSINVFSFSLWPLPSGLPISPLLSGLRPWFQRSFYPRKPFSGL